VRAFSEGPERGTELVVRLPLAPSTELHPADSEPTPRAGPGASLRVLVVDDNPDAAKMLGHLLRMVGHDVSLAHDGPAALAAASAAPLDLVLLDIGLPGMDGYAVAARLRAEGQAATMLVALTGYGREDDIRRSRDAGFDHHLSKPIDFAQLRPIIAEVSARRA
jgi:CheY-like chemotaxis protein